MPALVGGFGKLNPILSLNINNILNLPNCLSFNIFKEACSDKTINMGKLIENKQNICNSLGSYLAG